MKVSIIIAVYKDIKALNLIIKSLKKQTYKNFEVVISEDGEDNDMKKFIDSIKDLEVIHTTQKDLGIRKTRSLNNGILASNGEYLIFIDGDCIPYTTFIKSHVNLSQKNTILSGRRLNLGPKYSTKLRENKIDSHTLENNFLLLFPLVALDNIERHTEDGFYFSPNGFIYNNFIKNRNSSTSLLGCNYSCFKEDILKINGYDEGYGETAFGDDTDLEWRFKALGSKFKSVRNVANVFHLYHSRSFRSHIDYSKYQDKFNKNKLENNYICKEGLNMH